MWVILARGRLFGIVQAIIMMEQKVIWDCSGQECYSGDCSGQEDYSGDYSGQEGYSGDCSDQEEGYSGDYSGRLFWRLPKNHCAVAD